MESSNNNNNNDSGGSSEDYSSSSSSSFYYEELEKDILTHGLSDKELYAGNRALIVLGDFFHDNETGRDYERGIMLKGKRDFIGKTIVLSRNGINHLLTACCAISGLGVYRVSYSVCWTGPAEPEEIDYLYNTLKKQEHETVSSSLDIRLCSLLKSKEEWKYMVADLEKTNEEYDILIG